MMGIRGAALAAVIGRGTTVVIAMLVLVKRERLLTLERPNLRERG